MEEGLIQVYKEILRDVTRFSAEGSGIRLRSYQIQVAQAIVDSVIKGKGLSFVIIFPRQSGKNELQAQVEGYLLSLFSVEAVEMVKVSPTWKPQSLNAMRRLERVLKRNLISRGRWTKRSGYIYQFGEAMLHFLSGSPTSSIVGATASLLLECDEAQDVTISKWDKEIAPMAASTNATRVFWGTAWTSKTLLARELHIAHLAEGEDGIRRAWVLTAEEVGAEVPAYRNFVNEQVSRLGRNNPLVRTQYFSEEIDSEGGMFPLSRRMLMLGSHSIQKEPLAGGVYVFTIDVAGQDEAATDVGSGLKPDLQNPARDSTVLTIFQVDNSSVGDPLIGKPTYRVVNRLAWQGVKHSSLYGTMVSLAELWSPIRVIIDATGVGAGLANFLHDRLGSRLIPFEFTQSSKSDLGWDFITAIETGRYKEPIPLDEEISLQLEYCQYTILEGPGKIMRWGVPDGTRSEANGELVHDDYILSAALISLLDHETWGLGKSQVIGQKDILKELVF
jgi:hypothetical protein